MRLHAVAHGFSVAAFLLLAQESVAQCPELARTERPLQAASIMGFVYDAEGKLPVAGAKVWAEYDGPTAGILRETTTDDKGWFALTQVEPGPYWVIADKEEEGYPNPINALYNCPWWQFPKVTVKDRQPPIEVTLNLCPKVGKLKIHVVDADTRLALKSGMYGVQLAENPQVTSGGSSRWPGGDLILLLPPSPCRLKILAPGYLTWYYGEDRSEKGAELITLPSWTTRELTVLLKPARKAQGCRAVSPTRAKDRAGCILAVASAR